MKSKNIIAGATILFFLLFNFANAQIDNFRLSVSPASVSLVAEPGTKTETQIRVKNDGLRTEKIRVGVVPFVGEDENGKPRLTEQKIEDEYLKWITFSEQEFEIAPNEWRAITATLELPQDAAFSYFYAVTFSRAVNTDESAAANIRGSVAVLLLLEAKVPNAVRNIGVEEFSVDRPWYEFLPVAFRLRLVNTGNVHVAPRGNIFISRGEGKDISILDVNAGGGNILPASGRLFDASWNDGFPVYENIVGERELVLDENGRTVKKLSWDFSKANKFRWGKYYATLLMAYDDGERDVPVEGRLSFWVIPWRILLTVFFVSFLTLFGALFIVRGLIRMIFRRRSEQKKPSEKSNIENE